MDRIKVLYEDMTNEERELLKNKLNSIKVKGFFKHAKDRMVEKGITKADIFNTLKNYEVIEINYSFGTSPRVLLRSKHTDYNNYCTCVVLGFDGSVVTCYKNKKSDTHSTLNAKRYKDIYIKNLVMLILA